MGERHRTEEHVMSRRSLEPIVRLLRDYYGAPEPPLVIEPLELILWENVAYLVDDQKRMRAFALLKKRVGTAPEALLSAPESVLLEVAKVGGMFPEQRVRKLRTIAELVLSLCDGDLTSKLDGSFAQAKKVLRQFPGIGEPGAEKILLFSRKQAVLALDSNGLRVLLRVGFGEESKSYQATYRAVQTAAQASSQHNFDWFIETHQLLRHHGHMQCKRTSPLCPVCPLQASCQYYQNS
jgi:endonuclease III